MPGVAQLIEALLGIVAVQMGQGDAAILALDMGGQRMPGGAGGQVQGPVPGELVEALFQLAGVEYQPLDIGGGATQVREPVFDLQRAGIQADFLLRLRCAALGQQGKVVFQWLRQGHQQAVAAAFVKRRQGQVAAAGQAIQGVRHGVAGMLRAGAQRVAEQLVLQLETLQAIEGEGFAVVQYLALLFQAGLQPLLEKMCHRLLEKATQGGAGNRFVGVQWRQGLGVADSGSLAIVEGAPFVGVSV